MVHAQYIIYIQGQVLIHSYIQVQCCVHICVCVVYIIIHVSHGHLYAIYVVYKKYMQNTIVLNHS